MSVDVSWLRELLTALGALVRSGFCDVVVLLDVQLQFSDRAEGAGTD